MKPRRGDVVEVEWLDSEHIGIGWAATGEYIKAASEPQGYRTAGYYIAATGEHTLIALSIDPANRTMTHAMSIPSVAVKTTRVLGRADKRTRTALK